MGEAVGADHAALPHNWHGETTLPARVILRICNGQIALPLIDLRVFVEKELNLLFQG